MAFRWLDELTEMVLVKPVTTALEIASKIVPGIEQSPNSYVKSWKDYTRVVDREADKGNIGEVGVRVKRVYSRHVDYTEDDTTFLYTAIFETSNGKKHFFHEASYGKHEIDEILGPMEASYRAIYTAKQCLDKLKNPGLRNDFNKTNLTKDQVLEVISEHERDIDFSLRFNGNYLKSETVDAIVETCEERGWEPFETSGPKYEVPLSVPIS